MHSYSINSNERTRIPFYLAVIAILLALGTWRVCQLLEWTPWWWLDMPATMGYYGLLTLWFDRYGWRWKILSGWLIKTPVIGGDWKGVVKSSYDEHANEHSVDVSIRQTWSLMSIQLQAEKSTSKSFGSSVLVDGTTDLTYTYENFPHSSAASDMHAHRGTATLSLSTDGIQLTGEYYSGRDRQRHGEIRLARL